VERSLFAGAAFACAKSKVARVNMIAGYDVCGRVSDNLTELQYCATGFHGLDCDFVSRGNIGSESHRTGSLVENEA
jgi:hypothetical protein